MEEHRASLGRFLAEADGVDEASWMRPPDSGQWSPAQIAEHLSLVYRALLAELRGEGSLALRSPPWRRMLFRWLLLPHVLFHRRIPSGAPAPRETRPASPLAEREDLLRRLRERAEHFERELDAARRVGRGRLTHPYFGALSPLQTLRFCALHLEHHREQISTRFPVTAPTAG